MGAPKSKTTNSTMPPFQKEAFERTLDIWRNKYNSGQLNIKPYAGKSVASASPLMLRSWNDMKNLTGLSPASPKSRDYWSDVLGGKYLTQDAPGMQNIASQVQNRLNANAELAGRYGSGSHDQSVAQGLSQVYYDNYARERALQDAAAGGLLGADQWDRSFDFDATNALNQYGLQQRDIEQARLDAAKAKFEQKQLAPINALQLYQGGVLGANAGGSTTTTGGTPLWAQMLGAGIGAGGTAASGKGG